MEKEVIEGVIEENNGYWNFNTLDGSLYNVEVCIFIEETLKRTTKSGEKFRITIEKLKSEE